MNLFNIFVLVFVFAFAEFEPMALSGWYVTHRGEQFYVSRIFQSQKTWFTVDK